MTTTLKKTEEETGESERAEIETLVSLEEIKTMLRNVLTGFKFRTISTQDFSSRMIFQRQGKPQYHVLLLVHFALKFLAFFAYIFRSALHLSYISTFVCVLVLLSVDFWLTKNVCGRLLAGLRWWNAADAQTGQIVWKFEAWTHEERQLAHTSQIRLFWTGLIGQQIVWSLLVFTAVVQLKLGWFVLAVIACSLNGSNLYGFIRCRLQRNAEGEQGKFSSLFSRLTDSFVALFVPGKAVYTRASQSIDD